VRRGRVNRMKTKRLSRSAGRIRHYAGSKIRPRRSHTIPLRRPKPAEEPTDPRIQQQLKRYELAVRFFARQKFARALEIFEKVLTGPAKNLCERAEVHLRICRQRMARPAPVQLKTAEDFYDHGVSLMNMGRLEEAMPQLEKAKKLAPKADYVHYALATLACASSDAEAALEHLKRAIVLRAQNRYQARNDDDFAPLLDDPRFTELLYPERESPSA